MTSMVNGAGEEGREGPPAQGLATRGLPAGQSSQENHLSTTDPPPRKRPVIRIPSHTEVLNAHYQPSVPPVLFRPSSSPSACAPAAQTAAGALQPTVGTNRAPAALSGQPGFGNADPDRDRGSGSAPGPELRGSWPSTATTAAIANSSSSSSSSSLSNSFAEAFSFLKSSEFYSQPPLPPSAPSAAHRATGELPRVSPASTQASIPRPPVVSRNVLIVNNRQKGNPVLKYIRNIRWVFGDIVPDYQLGESSCALFISLRYHLLHPEYLYYRIRELQKGFRLRVVLCYVDVDDVIKPLHEVTRTALLHDCTLLCAWSKEECARYLETIKAFEHKSADSIQERTDHDYVSRLTSALTQIRHVNKTDVATLGANFGTLSAIMGASKDELAKCPGIGERKVKRLYDAFHEPFKRAPTAVRQSQAPPETVPPAVPVATGTAKGSLGPESTSTRA
ncbi:hypothetical protein CBR_g4857 [Chara braunii]|uniref:DNA excision repair protein ERCC-1 n=1 Tax=Chara braunii TaxID=69332 RepID=A0A388KIZ9_CHABU|nr:hypothetical protein CBR_g4857 [Chara braunii]|eukprot:GBG70030.1 hypothetical protein CBR_g4857 [Chara braunii]